MRAALLQRQAALAGVALLAALGVVALGGAGNGPAQPETPPPPTVRTQWQEARISVVAAERLGRPTACGAPLTAETAGIAHPVLPCGVALVVSANGREIRTRVVEQGGVPEGVAFELTPALAEELGVPGGGTIRWRFAE
ncbi:MAG TPA: hypothetical protein VHF23_09210 [Gaiellaceae bacterium]|nr:hypothetical protein [Gaiellaceae bacterium]